jgi:anaerobic selenocysteine-containing dehydrogenase
MPSLKELPVGMRLATALTSRREALRLLAAGIAAGLAGCSKPNEEIVPYVRVPEGLVPGDPLKFATTLPLSGYGRGVIVTAIDGRPIKVEGNPRHPASLGATDVFSEADVLSLYDPDRSRTVLKDGDIASWDQFLRALQSQRRRWTERQGEGLRLLTGRVTSPTLARQIDDLRKQFPKALWHSYASIDDEASQVGASLAYGRPLDSVPRLDRADIILTLDADPIGHGPDQIAHRKPHFRDSMPSKPHRL